MKPDNLFSRLPAELPEELVETLAAGACGGGVKIERIVSRGHASPPGFWYDQESTEWVILLQGSATLRFEDEAGPLALNPGDWLEIPPHRRHRIEETSTGGDTVWLAIHWG
jgi:cupin 2 domain-containing protein